MIIENNTVNVRQFGAKGDDTIDDTNAIQKTINFSSHKNYKILIPEGIFLISNLRLKDNSYIMGINRNSILKRNPTFSTDIYEMYYRHAYMLGIYTYNNRYKNITLKNFTIDGNSENIIYEDIEKLKSIMCQNILLRLVDNLTIQNVYSINSLKSGMSINASNNVLIEDNECCNNGIAIDGVDKNGISINGCYYRDDINDTIKYLCKNVKIFNNYCHNNIDEGIMYAYCNDITIDGNRLTENGDRGIEGDSSFKGAEHTDIIITNNFISDNGIYGITDHAEADNMNYICTGNIIKNCPDTALSIGAIGLSSLIIKDNIIENSRTRPVYVTGSKVIFDSNIIKNAKKSLTLAADENLIFSNNTIINEEITDAQIYLSGLDTIKIIGNYIKNFKANMFYLQGKDNETDIKNVYINGNSVFNSTYMVYIHANIENLKINDNQCFDTRETKELRNLLWIVSGYKVNFSEIMNNNFEEASQGMITEGITKLYALANGSKLANFFPTRSKPGDGVSTIFKKGAIVFNENPIPGSYVGWVFTGYAWKGFGLIEN